MSHEKSHWRNHQDKSSKNKMIFSTLNIRTRRCATANKSFVFGVNLDFNKTVSDTALDQHFYALNPFSLHPSKHTHLSF